MSKPARLQKADPITITLSPSIVIAGVILMAIMIALGFGTVESYNILMAGV